MAVIEKNRDEVWIIKFSPDGNFFVSAAKNQKIMIFRFDGQTLNFKAEGHNN